MKIFEEKLQAIFGDKHSGSVSILQKLLDLFLDQSGKDKNFYLRFISSLPEIESALGHFAVVKHFLFALEARLFPAKDHKTDKISLIRIIENYDTHWKNVNQKIASAALQNIQLQQKNILLHSNSSSVIGLFDLLAKSKIDVSIIQTESRPENEGIIQAETLAAMGFEVSLIVDSAAGLLMPQVDMVIFGADQVHLNYFVNKIGTYAIALLAGECNVPCYVLADSRKFDKLPGDPTGLLELVKPAGDIWSLRKKNIHPVNYYFETIPCTSIETFITENGIIQPEEISSQ